MAPLGGHFKFADPASKEPGPKGVSQFMAKDGALMVELLSDLLMRPTLDPGEFEKLRDNRIDSLVATKDGSPQSLLGAYFEATVFGDHPFARRVGGDETSLAALSMGDLRSFYNDQVGADRMQITVAGDFEIAEMRDLLVASFGGWRAGAQRRERRCQAEPFTGTTDIDSAGF